ncbi:MAG: alpha-L-fucosidase [Bacteroidetes bacterium]|nr:alpha-L-fucosidase [Bacteroidota bacterium]
MKKRYILAFVLLTVNAINSFAQENNVVKDNKDARMEWWREARFGMFIHWGLYSIPAGQWGEEKNHAEWVRETAHIPVTEYEKLLKQFNPVQFNAEQWVKYAKDAGIKYIVLTSKHHDGFCLFDSKYTDFDVMSTPFKRDILKELADACRKYGLKICWYHSIMDWHHPDYLPRREWEKDIRPINGADFNRYFAYLKNELTEILTNYGDISVIWFDGEWESTWNHQYATELYNYLRKLKPDLIINNRIDSYRAGMAGFSTNPDALGDYGTPEQEIPENGLPGVDWETCMTMNDHWGFNQFDHNWKSTKTLIENLVDVASKGGNYLLNVGPTAMGVLPPESIERLENIGKWMKVNGASVYGTKASPFKSLSWGKCTQKETANGTILYFHLFDWPKNKKIVLDNLLNEPLKANLLADLQKKSLPIKKTGIKLEISLPEKATDEVNSVVVLEIKGKAQVIDAPEFNYTYDESKDMLSVSLKSKIDNDKLSIHYTTDGTTPKIVSPVFTSSLILKKQNTFKAAAFYNKIKFGKTTSIKIPLSYGITPTLKPDASKKYYARGAASLCDGNYGTKNYNDNNWLGFEGDNFNAVIDLGKACMIKHTELHYLLDSRAWIFEPTYITVEVSTDGKNFNKISSFKTDTVNWKSGKAAAVFAKDFKAMMVRYVRFTAGNRGVCPAGHQGAGGKSWIFISEVVVD